MSLLLLLSVPICHLGLEPRPCSPYGVLSLVLHPPQPPTSATYFKILSNSFFNACWDLRYPKAGHNLRCPGVVTAHIHCMSIWGTHPNSTSQASSLL